MIIKSVQKNDGTTYKCIAENGYGKDERIVKLVVKDVPSPPTNVRVKETWSRSASVVWTSGSDGNSPIKKYIVHYWAHDSLSKRLFEMPVLSTQKTILIKDLKPGLSYEITVIAENDVGPSESADPATFITLPEGIFRSSLLVQ